MLQSFALDTHPPFGQEFLWAFENFRILVYEFVTDSNHRARWYSVVDRRDIQSTNRNGAW